jgi:hypothetical protein
MTVSWSTVVLPRADHCPMKKSHCIGTLCSETFRVSAGETNSTSINLHQIDMNSIYPPKVQSFALLSA